MLLSYPLVIETDENGTFIGQFSDVPEAMTAGIDESDLLSRAQDALVVALTGYMDDKRNIPSPSRRIKGQRMIPLPSQVAMKLVIYQGMRDQGLTQLSLGKRMGVADRQVRRILDLDHNTSLSQLVRALKCLGKEVVIDIHDAS